MILRLFKELLVIVWWFSHSETQFSLMYLATVEISRFSFFVAVIFKRFFFVQVESVSTTRFTFYGVNWHLTIMECIVYSVYCPPKCIKYLSHVLKIATHYTFKQWCPQCSMVISPKIKCLSDIMKDLCFGFCYILFL